MKRRLLLVAARRRPRRRAPAAATASAAAGAGDADARSPTTRSPTRQDVAGRIHRPRPASRSTVAKGAATPATLVNKAILTKGKPEGDVLWGVDNTLLSRAVAEGVFVPYESPALATLTRAVPRPRARPRGHARRLRRRLPQLRQGLVRGQGHRRPADASTTCAKPAYKDLLVVENPATSSPGLAFLLATIAHFGDRRLAGVLERPAGQRREGGRRLDTGLLHRLLRPAGKGARPARRQLRVEPAGRDRATPTIRSRPSRRRPRSTPRASGRSSSPAILQGTKHEKEARPARRLPARQGAARTTCRSTCSCTRCAGRRPARAVHQVRRRCRPASLIVPPQDIAAHRDAVDRRSGPTIGAALTPRPADGRRRCPDRLSRGPPGGRAGRLPGRLLRLAGRQPSSGGASRPARSPTSSTRPRAALGGLVHAVAGGGQHRAHRCRSGCPPAYVVARYRVPRAGAWCSRS